MLNDYAAEPSVFFRDRSMEEMLVSLNPHEGALRAYDGWRRTLLSGSGFRHDYDAEVACGSWEFYRLSPGLCLTVADIVATDTIARRHRMRDQLVLSVVLEGEIPLADDRQAVSMAGGYCTYYGMDADDEVRTTYAPGCPLKWVSVFVDRKALCGITGLAPAELSPRVADFVRRGGMMAPRNVPLSHAASLAAKRIKECPYQGGYRRVFLSAKALELVCEVLFVIAHEAESEEFDATPLSREDYRRLEEAHELIEANLGEPPNIPYLAALVGLTRQKLQLGFRLMYGDTVARVRDRLRMEHALELVRRTDAPMIKIALETGYEHPASFTRAFKAAYGASPMQMRRMAQDASRVERIERRTCVR